MVVVVVVVVVVVLLLIISQSKGLVQTVYHLIMESDLLFTLR